MRRKILMEISDGACNEEPIQKTQAFVPGIAQHDTSPEHYVMSRMSRRNFLKTSAAVAAGIAVPYVIPGGVLAEPGREGANDRLNVGFVGLGGRGSGHLNNEKQMAAAVCDVDKNHLAKAVKVAGQKAFVTTDY